MDIFAIGNIRKVASSKFSAVITNKANVRTCEEAGDTSNTWGPEVIYVRDLGKICNFGWDNIILQSKITI
jgi:hypothetical protein